MYLITIKVRPLLQQMHYCTCKRHRMLRKDGHKNKWAADHRERQRCTLDRPPSIHYEHTWVPRTHIQIPYITPSQLSIIKILGYLGQKIQLQIPYIKPSIYPLYTYLGTQDITLKNLGCVIIDRHIFLPLVCLHDFSLYDF